MNELNRGMDIHRYFGFKRASRDARPMREEHDRGEVGQHRLKRDASAPHLKKNLRALGIVKRHGRWVRA